MHLQFSGNPFVRLLGRIITLRDETKAFVPGQSTGIESSYFHMLKQVIEPQTASASPGGRYSSPSRDTSHRLMILNERVSAVQMNR